MGQKQPSLTDEEVRKFRSFLHQIAENRGKRQLAQDIGMPYASMVGVLNGTYRPGLPMVHKVAVTMGTTAERLLGRPDAAQTGPMVKRVVGAAFALGISANVIARLQNAKVRDPDDVLEWLEALVLFEKMRRLAGDEESTPPPLDQV